MLLTKKFGFLFLVLVFGFSLSNKCIKSCQSTFSHSIFQAVTVRPLSSAWTKWSILNSRRASPKIPETWPEFFGFSHLWPEKPEILLSETQPRPEFSGWWFFLGFLGFEDHVAHPTNSQKGVKIFLNSRRASPNVEKNPGNRRWQMYILRNGCEPGKSKRICDPTGISPNFLTLHSFSWKWQHCVLSFCWADTGFKVID